MKTTLFRWPGPASPRAGRAVVRAVLSKLLLGAIGFVIVTCGAVHAWRVSANANLGVNTTPSVPLGLYALYPASVCPEPGSYVCLLGVSPLAPEALQRAIATGLTPSSWQYTPLLKKVVGVAGDLVTYEHEQVLINGRPLPNSRVKQTDSLGQRLPAPTYPLRLRSDEVWLASQHVHGFDSRYFGPVRVSALSCEGRPLWTF